MNSQTVVQNAENTDNATRIMSLLETLRQKVQNFAVLDMQGQRVGEVNNLVLDANRQLNLVVSEDPNPLNNNRFFLLPSKLIKKIDTSTRSVYMEIDKLAISNQEYLGQEIPSNEKILDNSHITPVNNSTLNSTVEQKSNLEKVVEEDIIRLLGERLIVDSTKRKIGEVIVRKEIETRMVQVPVRREKLIVEQISPEHKQLAEIDLGLTEISGIDLAENQKPAEFASLDGSLTVSGDFSSPKIASLLLNAIALERNHKCKQVRVTIVVEDESTQNKYQEWFDRCSQGQDPNAEK
ncbi:DUF2382 domain-containing protein [Hassallia byssoidea VB512170]|uniref:DUF2382 domain-containing protein n=1 Tax=Hassallia byssoidea VB512170 TaxID=1304833 RepID=A0A846H4T7_9CYAN|nr:DUF2382 domain-containing protein [Hassalia byssoidea]NEU72436.1 DUF2382 domain-containing protein [Hassalia byssoidea VB512170]